METVISIPKSKRDVFVAPPLSKKGGGDVMEEIEKSKVKGVPYIECVKDGENKGKVGVWPPPSAPPFTTWSGLMLCEADSPHTERLIQKCGGLLIKKDGAAAGENAQTAVIDFWKAQAAQRSAEKVDENLVAAAAAARAELKNTGAVVLGYWTAPEDWVEMVAGKEDPTPCSTKDYPKPSFLPSWT